MKERIRVLVVDDSAFARKVIREVLSSDPEVEVVGIARDGLDGLEKIAELSPDVVTLDLLMPGLDGLGVLKALAASTTKPAPRVVVVSTAEQDGELAVEALQLGAVEMVHKPTSLATARLYELAKELVSKVKTAAVARPGAGMASLAARGTEGALAAADERPPRLPRIVVVGASTGGPQALTRLLAELPADFPVPVALVLHMPVGYTAALAARLNTASPLDVVEASEGLVLRPRMAVLARAGLHMKIVTNEGLERVRLDVAPLDTPHRPAVDQLFLSAAQTYGGSALGVVLTGMGDDGLVGSQAIAAAGGWIFTESASSCVVYGMPRSVDEAGVSTRSFALGDMASALRAAVAPAASRAPR